MDVQHNVPPTQSTPEEPLTRGFPAAHVLMLRVAAPLCGSLFSRCTVSIPAASPADFPNWCQPAPVGFAYTQTAGVLRLIAFD